MVTFSLQKGCLILRLRAQKNDPEKRSFFYGCYSPMM